VPVCACARPTCVLFTLIVLLFSFLEFLHAHPGVGRARPTPNISCRVSMNPRGITAQEHSNSAWRGEGADHLPCCSSPKLARPGPPPPRACSKSPPRAGGGPKRGQGGGEQQRRRPPSCGSGARLPRPGPPLLRDCSNRRKEADSGGRLEPAADLQPPNPLTPSTNSKPNSKAWS
jgi:hypothetical protein